MSGLKPKERGGMGRIVMEGWNPEYVLMTCWNGWCQVALPETGEAHLKYILKVLMKIGKE